MTPVWYTLPGTPTASSHTAGGLLPSPAIATPPSSPRKGKAIEVVTRPKPSTPSILREDTAAYAVFHCLELMVYILRPLEWEDVITIGVLNRRGREVAEEVILMWLRDLLEPFMSRASVTTLMMKLNMVNGGIVGSVVRRLFAMNASFFDDEEDCINISSDINFVVPTVEGIPLLKEFLEEAVGIKTWTARSPQACYRQSVCVFISGTTQVGRVRRTKKTERRVTISAARGNILDIVTSSPFSAQQNLLTSSRAYCFWPNLATSFASYMTDLPVAHVPPFVPFCFTGDFDQMTWSADCGPWCPAEQRNTVGDEGIASFRYTMKFESSVPESRFPDTDYLLAQSCISFRLSIRCKNGLCHNYVPDLVDISSLSLF